MSKARRKKCKECKELFTLKYSTLQKCCSTKCAIAYSKKKDTETKEKNDKVLEAMKDLEIVRKKEQSLGKLKKQTQLLVNKYIRLRDIGKPCISQNTPYKKDYDAGHCFPVGSYEGLRYDLDNIHGQSIGANRFKEGDHVNYLLNLPNRIGQDRFDLLIEKAKDYKRNGYKFSKHELLETQKNIKKLIKELKKING